MDNVVDGFCGKELMMRLKISVLSFVFALVVGIGLSLVPAAVDWLWPSFSKEKAEAMVGRRVQYRRTEKFRGMKCPQTSFCEEIRGGEYGTIIGVERVPDGGYFVVVRWDEPSGQENYLSYFGRYTHRESLIEE